MPLWIHKSLRGSSAHQNNKHENGFGHSYINGCFWIKHFKISTLGFFPGCLIKTFNKRQRSLCSFFDPFESLFVAHMPPAVLYRRVQTSQTDACGFANWTI